MNVVKINGVIDLIFKLTKIKKMKLVQIYRENQAPKDFGHMLAFF